MIALLAAFGAGCLLLPLFGRRLPSPGALLALGLSLVAWLGWVGALAGWRWQPAALVLATLGAGVLGYRIAAGPRPRIHALPAVTIVFGVALGALATGWPLLNYDVLSYHLAMARAVADPASAAGMFHEPAQFYARLPLAAPLVQSLSIGSGATAFTVGAAFHWFAAGLVVATALSAGRVAGWLGGRPPVRALAMALVLLHPVYTRTEINGLFDGALALCLVGGIELFLQGRSAGRPVLLFLGGLAAGTGFAFKVNAVGVVILPFAVYTILASLRGGRGGIAALALAGAGGFVAAAPWLGRSLMVGGHVAFPFAGEDPGWVAGQAAFVVGQHGPRSPLSGGYWADFFLGPLATPLGLAVPAAALVAVYTAGLAMAWRWRRAEAALGIAALAGYGAWTAVDLNPDRFLLPVVALYIVGLSLLVGRVMPVARLRPAVALLLLALFAVASFTDPRFSFGVLSWRVGERNAIARELSEAARLASFLEDDPAARPLLVFEARAGLFPPGTGWAPVWDRPPYADALRAATATQDLADRLAAAGYTHVVVNEFEWGRLLDFYGGEKPPGAPAAERGLLGLRAPLPRERLVNRLAAFPPHRFAALDEATLALLLDFLLDRRRAASHVVAAGPHADAWIAPITSPPDD